MKKDVLFTLPSPYREPMRVMGYRFGKGEKACAIMGATRGNEVQQLYVCSQLIAMLRDIEADGAMVPGKSVLVIPTANNFTMNISKRFWPMDNTDINRMVPGKADGETTQRIAYEVFERLRCYTYGMQLASFYMPGTFIPHVRMMETGRQNAELARDFGLPYVYVRTPKTYDAGTLNYNWQMAGTNAFSLYAGPTEAIDENAADICLRAILRFLNQRRIVRYDAPPGHTSAIITDADMHSVYATSAGLLRRIKFAGAHVRRGEQLAFIIDPYDGNVREVLRTPVTGTLFFVHDRPFVMEHTPVYKVLG